jgi:uncharacterized protein YcbK (DUF882 family)
MDEQFLQMLDDAREFAGVPFKITSGFRTPEHSHAIGSNDKSSHCKGLAADIACGGSRERMEIIIALLTVGFDRIGIGDGFIHVDADVEKDEAVIWTYY